MFKYETNKNKQTSNCLLYNDSKIPGEFEENQVPFTSSASA